MTTMRANRRQFPTILAVMLAVGCLASLCAEVRVTEVSVAQRWPWNGLVDITYSIECDDAGALFFVSFSGYDRDLDRAVGMTAVTGDGVASAVKPGGPYTATWDSTQDAPEFHSSGFEVTVTAEEIEKPPYLVVDLLGGPSVRRYPVRYSSIGPDLSDDTCRTTELWLRRIPAGTFIMGSPSDELGRETGFPSETQHKVTLTQDYYIGVFECTQKQYELVMGTRPSFFSNEKYYAIRPVEQVSFDGLRGTSFAGGVSWPEYGHVVDASSFFGKLQAKTGLTFDLPTEAQWEYACRASTTTALNSGKNLTSIGICENMSKVGRYGYAFDDAVSSWNTSHGTAKVGNYLPNAWGLYDMHGNVWEWCLDRWSYDMSSAAVIDPVGPAVGISGSADYCVCRGGSWVGGAHNCRSASRGFEDSTYESSTGGFRCAILLSGGPSFAVVATGAIADKAEASPGETVTLTATLPEGANAADYEIAWSSVPNVEFDANDDGSASIMMPCEAIEITCIAFKKIPFEEDLLYLVVDLSGGDNAESYPVHFSATGPDLSDDACRTTELWLRRIPAGTFLMGSPEDELGRSSNEMQHQVTLTQDFYIGVFECTQRQYELVTGAKPSYFFHADYYATRPVEQVSYHDLRGASATAGAGWPEYGHVVDEDSFFGILQSKTGLAFDLPTEAQWEYACRAGTATALNSGKNLTSDYYQCPNMDEVGRYYYNGGANSPQFCTTAYGTAKVGSYLPNAWGLYDMHGNVWEWCLDWYVTYSAYTVADPVGASSGSHRVKRGGSWSSYYCRSAYRSTDKPLQSGGFRVAFHTSLPMHSMFTVMAAGATADKGQAKPGETVTLTATLPEGMDASEYDFTWSSIPEVNFTTDGATASFIMPVGTIEATCIATLKPYLAVDLSGGPNASSYPVRYSAIGPNLFNDACRTTELWLRRIPAGSFLMGSPEDELGRYDSETQHQVTLTQDFYIGVFECTQRQYELVMGSNPSYYKGDTRPVEKVSYNDLRGTLTVDWPLYGHAVDTSSFFGKLQAKTGLVFDLPTEAQWEYACRAGTTTALNSDKNLTATDKCPNMAEVGRYSYNKTDGKGGYSQHTMVGSYFPNAWGLYDMHGNVWEWCLDWYQSNLGTASFSNPVGASSGSSRVARGGSWINSVQGCRSAFRSNIDSSNCGSGLGFRVSFCPFETFPLPIFTVAAIGAITDKAEASPGETVTLTAALPEGANDSNYEIIWSSMPEVNFTTDGATASFTMPVEAIEVTCIATLKPYLVVELSGGTNASSYPVRYSSIGPDLSDDACRTTELWLRRIPAGTFLMGSPADELGREPDETLHSVTLTQDYYIGVFECTQRQYELVMDTNPSYFINVTYYATRPVEQVSYDDLRGTSTIAGAGWPACGHAVDASSFFGKLQAKTSLAFDLPTEAQWEYACRAGTTTALNSGKNLTDTQSCPNLAEVGRCRYNSGSGYSQTSSTANGTAKVGSYFPNVWGLYDMHGNVYEWCLDWHNSYGSATVTDQAGPSSGLRRVERGGSWSSYYAQYCRSASRNGVSPSSCGNYRGFRIVFIP